MRRAAFALLGAAAFFWAVRLPFAWHPLVGEEGIFAYLIHQQPVGPAYGLMTRLHGQDQVAPLAHPAGLYESLRLAGKAVARPLRPWLGADASARISVAFFSALIWSLIALRLLLQGSGSRASWAWWAALGASPLAIVASVTLQTDCSAGVLLTGLLALALAGTGPRSRLAALAAAFALGLAGKQEWSLAFLAALALAGALGSGQPGWKGLLALALSCILGNAASWAMDPVNYLGAFGVMRDITASRHLGAPGAGGDYLRDNLLRRGPFIAVWAAMLGALFWQGLSQALLGERRNAIVLAYSAALGLPYLSTNWGADFRYFAPAFTVAAVLFLGQLRRFGAVWHSRRVVQGLGALMLLQWLALVSLTSLGRSLIESPGKDLHQVAERTSLKRSQAAQAHCVPLLDSAVAWDSDEDFVGLSLGPQGGEQRCQAAGLAFCGAIQE